MRKIIQTLILIPFCFLFFHCGFTSSKNTVQSKQSFNLMAKSLEVMSCAKFLYEDISGSPYEEFLEYGIGPEGVLIIESNTNSCEIASQAYCSDVSQYTSYELEFVQDEVDGVQVCGCQCQDINYCDQYANDDQTAMAYDAHGAGSTTDPYRIYNAYQLVQIANTQDALSKAYIECSNINVDQVYGQGQDDFKIGTVSDPFVGSFNGNGFIISKFRYNNTSQLDNIGLFGYTREASFKNIKLENVNISLPNGANIGGLIGVADEFSSIENCSVSGNISGESYTGGLVGQMKSQSLITGSFSTAYVSGTGYATGGLVASMSDLSQITYCYAKNANILGFEKVGGLVGESVTSTIDRSYSNTYVHASKHVGGLVGESNSSSITNSYAVGKVDGEWSNIGGLIGNSFLSTIDTCYATGDVFTTLRRVGGLIGQTEGDQISNTYATGDVTAIRYGGGVGSTGGLIGLMRNSILENSYAANNLVFGTYKASSVGGLIGFVISPDAIIRKNFVVSQNIINESPVAVHVVGMIAADHTVTGIPTFSQNYFLYPVNCTIANGDDCNLAYGSSVPQEDYFYNSSNPPMNSWPVQWIFSPGTLPRLDL